MNNYNYSNNNNNYNNDNNNNNNESVLRKGRGEKIVYRRGNLVQYPGVESK